MNTGAQRTAQAEPAPPTDRSGRTKRRARERTLADEITLGVRSGEFEPCDPDDVADQLVARA